MEDEDREECARFVRAAQCRQAHTLTLSLQGEDAPVDAAKAAMIAWGAASVDCVKSTILVDTKRGDQERVIYTITAEGFVDPDPRVRLANWGEEDDSPHEVWWTADAEILQQDYVSAKDAKARGLRPLPADFICRIVTGALGELESAVAPQPHNLLVQSTNPWLPAPVFDPGNGISNGKENEPGSYESRGLLYNPDASEAYGVDWFPADVVNAAVRDTKHAAKWMQKVARTPTRYPAIVRLLKKWTSPRGLNARGNRINLFRLIRLGTPEWLEHKLWGVRSSCVTHLRRIGVERCIPAWWMCAYALDIRRQTCKAGVIAAALNLGCGLHSYRNARHCLTEHQRYLISVSDLHVESVRRTVDRPLPSVRRHDTIGLFGEMEVASGEQVYAFEVGREGTRVCTAQVKEVCVLIWWGVFSTDVRVSHTLLIDGVETEKYAKDLFEGIRAGRPIKGDALVSLMGITTEERSRFGIYHQIDPAAPPGYDYRLGTPRQREKVVEEVPPTQDHAGYCGWVV